MKDPEAGEGRRVDAMVVKDGEVFESKEFTGKGVDNKARLAKEDRIREAGGNYIKDATTSHTPNGT